MKAEKPEIQSLLVDCRYGDFAVFSSPDLICDSLRVYGEWAQNEIELISQFVEAGETVLDIGSYIGTHARAFSNFVGKEGTVFAFEPNPKAFDMLMKNAELSPNRNIRSIHCALGKQLGFGYLLEEDKDNIGATSVRNAADFGGSAVHEVTIKTVDSLKFEQVDFMKLDVEGNEWNVLIGAQKTIQDLSPIVNCELNSFEAGCLAYFALVKYGYECFGYSIRSYNPDNYKCSDAQLYYSGAREFGLLFIPKKEKGKIAIAEQRKELARISDPNDINLLLQTLSRRPDADKPHMPNFQNSAQSDKTADFQDECPSDLRTDSSMKLDLFEARPSATVKFWVDKKVCIGLRLEIEGWFYSNDSVTIAASLILECTRSPQFFPVKIGVERRDVFEARNEIAGMTSGFCATCHLDPSCGNPIRGLLSFKLENLPDPVVFSVKLTAELPTLGEFLKIGLRVLKRDSSLPNIAEIPTKGFESYWLQVKALAVADRFSEQSATTLNSLAEILPIVNPNPSVVPDIASQVFIIIPIYKSLEFLDPLFDSLVQNTADNHKIILIDNGNTDKTVRNKIARFAKRRKNVEILRLEENQGFVGAINRGAELAQSHMILLNSDVVIPPYWVERLIEPLETSPDIATVTPMSNAATVCSFPQICIDNKLYGGFTTAQIDRWFHCVDVAKLDTDLLSGVGFCMAINFEVWKKIGPFDEVSFRHGYGEENDWCLKAIKFGFRNIVAPNVFAYHKHGGTFESSSRAALRQASLDVVARRFPRYLKQVGQYIRRDPLKGMRNLLAILIAFSEYAGESYLVIDHELGGGANQYRRRLVEKLSSEGRPVLTLVPSSAGATTNYFRLDFVFQEFRTSFTASDISELKELLCRARPKRIILNNLVGYGNPLELVSLIRFLKHETQTKIRVLVHDFFALCPSYTLLSNEHRYCDLPSVEKCKICLPANPYANNPKRQDISYWRETWNGLLTEADEIVCFSNDSKQKFAKVFPALKSSMSVEPHKLDVAFSHRPLLTTSKSVNIGVVGAIGPQKGASVVRNLAREMSGHPHASITVIGTIDKTEGVPRLKITGHYSQSELPNLLEKHKITICFLPSIWPETFSYVAEELMALDVPLVVFDIGAPAERVRSYRKGKVLDLKLADRPHDLLEAIFEFSSKLGQRLS